MILVTYEMPAVIARSEQWDRLPACLFGMTGKMPVPPSISEAGDCFGLGALAMTTVSNVIIFYGELVSPLSALVRLSPVADFYHNDLNLIIFDLIDNAVNTLAYAISFLAGQLLADVRARLFRQRIEPFQNAGDVLLGNASKIFSDRFLEDQPIFSHEP
jgi:hypothetical protein